MAGMLPFESMSVLDSADPLRFRPCVLKVNGVFAKTIVAG
jgi:hypothetical protein